MNSTVDTPLYENVKTRITERSDLAADHLHWLREQMDPYFAITMQEEADAISVLAMGLHTLSGNQRLLLADREKTLILARLSHPGSLYDSLKTLHEREISYAEFTHSRSVVPGLAHELEVQRFDFDRRDHG